MSQTLHIVRKDLRRLRWVLLLWVAVLATRVALSLSVVTAAGESVSGAFFLRQLSSPIVTVELLMTALIVVLLVHEEALVGFTAFWLTRPYDRGALVRAKLLLAIVVLVGLPLLADLTTMGLLKAGPVALTTAGSTAAVAYVGGTLALLVAAALTPSFSAFALTVLGVVVGTLMLAGVRVGVASLWRGDPFGYTLPTVPDATPAVVMLAVYAAAALCVVLYQYRHRRWRVATGLAILGCGATIVVPILWPWSFARGEEIQPGAWAAAAAVVHDSSSGTEVGEMGRIGRGPLRRQVRTRITLSGLPPRITVYQTGVRSTLHLPDGISVQSSQMGWGVWSSRVATIAALGGPRLLYSSDVSQQESVPMITLTEDQFMRYRGRSGRLEAVADFQLMRTREVAVLPLMPGAALDDGVSRTEIVDVLRRTSGRDIILRRWRVQSLLSAQRPPNRSFALRNRARGEALLGVFDSTGGGAPLGSSPAMERLRFPLGVLVGLYVGGAVGVGDGFSTGTTFLQFPGRGVGKAAPPDPAWFDEAELVLLETEWAGIVTRRLTIEEFMVPAN